MPDCCRIRPAIRVSARVEHRTQTHCTPMRRTIPENEVGRSRSLRNSLDKSFRGGAIWSPPDEQQEAGVITTRGPRVPRIRIVPGRSAILRVDHGGSSMHRSVLCRGVVAVVLAAGATVSGNAQAGRRSVRIVDVLACPQCVVTFAPTVTLVAPAGLVVGRPETVRVDSQGRYWLLGRGFAPVLFDGDGRFLRTLGRLGAGPNEVRNPYDLLAVDGDSVVVLDSGNRRAAVLSPTLEVVRYVALPFHLLDPIAVSWPSRIVSSGNVPTPEGAGFHLHRMSFMASNGTIVQSFGPNDGELRGPESLYLGWHRLAAPNNGTFWSAGMYRYDLFHWDSSGTMLRAIERRPSWFRGTSAMNSDLRTEPPAARIAAIQQDSDGLLWIFIRVAASSWREAVPAIPDGVNEIPTRLIAMEKLFSTMIEVLDPRTNRVVARRMLDRYLLASLSNRRVAFYEVLPDGRDQVVVGTLSVSR